MYGLLEHLLQKVWFRNIKQILFYLFCAVVISILFSYETNLFHTYIQKKLFHKFPNVFSLYQNNWVVHPNLPKISFSNNISKLVCHHFLYTHFILQLSKYDRRIISPDKNPFRCHHQHTPSMVILFVCLSKPSGIANYPRF